MFRKLEDLEVYQLSERLSDAIWQNVLTWEFFAKDTVGKQLVRAVDSIPANLSEGYGRYSYKENIQFCYYARGSLEETRNWIRRPSVRALCSKEQIDDWQGVLDLLGRKLNAYINSIKVQSRRSPVGPAPSDK